MTVVQQIVFTGHPERWLTLAEALGFVAPYPPTSEWGEFRADGSLAVRRATGGQPAGSVALQVLVEDLGAAQSALSGFVVKRESIEGIGDVLTVDIGLRFSVSEGDLGAPTGEISVAPVLFQDDFTAPRRALTALGLRPDLASDGGGWLALLADGGSVGVHGGTPARVGLSFEALGDLDALAERLRGAGFDAAIVDEAYARTIRIPDPDGGEEIWINGAQDDLYGYHREA